MKLTIKTLDQKTFHVEFDDTKTVWELKEVLSNQPEVAVQPELQQVIYAGRVLVNEHVLQSYSIDERKFLVVMAKKAPTGASESTAAKKEEKKTEEKKPEIKTETPKDAAGPSRRKSADQQSTPASPIKEKPSTPAAVTTTPVAAAEPAPTPSQPTSSILAAADAHPPTLGTGVDNAALVQSIVSMGYPEAEVRRALIASFNNPDRAIEYLIEGIPDIPEMLEAHSSASEMMQQSESINPLAFLRQDPRFNQMRRVIQQRPELVSTLLAKIGETNPALLTVIRENQEEFLRMLNENVDDVGGIDAASVAAAAAAGELEDNVVEIVLTDAERLAVERLVGLGFPREIVVRAYIACEKNEEQTADFLCRHMEDN